MAKQDYSFPNSSPSDKEVTPATPKRAEYPRLTVEAGGIAEQEGFPAETIEGEALLAKNLGGATSEGALRDGDNSKSLGTVPDYPINLMDQFAKGVDIRNGR